MSAISVQLGHLRLARGLTQQQIAERTGLRRDTISALERGKSRGIEFETLALLCDALGVGAGDLLALAPTAHAAPILGGDDEDEIIAERRAEADDEIAALIADPALAARALTGEFALPPSDEAITPDAASTRVATPEIAELLAALNLSRAGRVTLRDGTLVIEPVAAMEEQQR